tara:strand:- start:3169 stop:3912 length:744 start_codon:yes stop_codon:yes gene_type:complete
MKLILLRHGESQWNLENRFTGWKDVPLTKSGIIEASLSAEKLVENDIKLSTIQTSLLQRAVNTAKIISERMEFPVEKIEYDWRLNERHYGALEGLNKSETALKYGEKQVLIWRRSYDVVPPLLELNDKRHPKFNLVFKNIEAELPSGESLKNVIDRLNPFWENYFENIKKNLGNHLIVAHSNSLRAIIKILENLSDEEIMSVNIPTGVPLIYTFNNDFKIINKSFLIDEKDLIKKQKKIVNQGKINK